ncbi:MAG TPA: hypothetical protein VFJ43_16165, partial [Bacteroidia bacterium]|nr:hypothetical protein [Bacteroidia bacterium]
RAIRFKSSQIYIQKDIFLSCGLSTAILRRSPSDLTQKNGVMHKPYEITLGHPADFRVRYCYYLPEDGGRKIVPSQGIRSDFWYDFPNDNVKGMFMIWPEFEDENGNVILEGDVSVNRCGTARMWIINPERRPEHIGKIKIGLKCYFMEGQRKVAECEVVELLSLNSNPVTSKK